MVGCTTGIDGQDCNVFEVGSAHAVGWIGYDQLWCYNCLLVSNMAIFQKPLASGIIMLYTCLSKYDSWYKVKPYRLSIYSLMFAIFKNTCLAANEYL